MLRDVLPEHTSASQLVAYARCPRAYAYKYVERREPEVRAPGLALGSAVHTAVAWWFEERAAERDPEVEHALGVFRADLAAATALDSMRWGTTTPAALEEEGERLVRHFVEEMGQLPVVETEVRFDFLLVDPDTGEQLPRALVGFFDAELANGNFVELKTAKRSYSPVDLRAGLQFAAYRTAAQHFGVDVELIALVRNKRPRIQQVTLPHDRDVSRWFLRSAAAIERAILAGHFPPAPGQACASCDYRGACLGLEAEAADADAEAA
jgi:CRISPR/Cas system-associated exonuclease Cas4 (RecB family)